jgi:hypothetical protein
MHRSTGGSWKRGPSRLTTPERQGPDAPIVARIRHLQHYNDPMPGRVDPAHEGRPQRGVAVLFEFALDEVCAAVAVGRVVGYSDSVAMGWLYKTRSSPAAVR